MRTSFNFKNNNLWNSSDTNIMWIRVASILAITDFLLSVAESTQSWGTSWKPKVGKCRGTFSHPFSKQRISWVFRFPTIVLTGMFGFVPVATTCGKSTSGQPTVLKAGQKGQHWSGIPLKLSNMIWRTHPKEVKLGKSLIGVLPQLSPISCAPTAQTIPAKPTA